MGATARLLAAIGLNNEQFKAGLASTRTATAPLHRDFAALETAIAGAFSVGAIAAFSNSIKRYAEEQADAVAVTGATTTSIQALNAVAQDNAADSEKMRAGLEKVRNAQISALESSGASRTAFEKLGITMAEIEAVGADRVFELIGTRIATAENKTQALAAAGDILGAKLINKLLPALQVVGTEGLDELNKRMTESGRVMDAKIIAKIDVLSDKIEANKTKLIVWATETLDFFERLGTGIGNILSSPIPEGSIWPWFDMFAAGWNDAAYQQEQAEKRMIKAANEANAAILENEDDTSTKRIELAKLVAAAKEEAALAEIAAGQEIRARMDKWSADARARDEADTAKHVAERQKQLSADIAAFDAIGFALNDLSATQDRIYFDSLTAEQQLAFLIEKRARLEKERADLFAGGYEKTTEGQLRQIALEKELALLGEDIAKRTADGAQVTAEAKIEDVKLTEEQVRALDKLRLLLKKMSDAELTDFIADVKALHAGIGNLDFSGLNGLAALKGFRIPKTSVDDAKEFGAAIAAMFTAIAAVPNIPDLAPLDHLKDLKFSSDDSRNFGKMGNAILRFLDDLNNSKLDLGEIQTISDLFAAIKSGEVKISLTAPSKDQLTLSIDESFKADLSSLAASAKTIATFKGTIYA
mgnify:CR=1 FL=1